MATAARRTPPWRAFGAELLEIGRDFDMAREAAERLAVERGLEMVPFISSRSGQGVATYALEFFRGRRTSIPFMFHRHGVGHCRADPDARSFGLGDAYRGRGLDSGPAFALSFKSSKVVTTPTADTFADGVACRTPMADAVRIVCAGAERIVSVSEEEIAEAMRAYFVDTHNAAEGAGAAALAALMQEGDRMRGKRVGLILSGGNIDMPMFAASSPAAACVKPVPRRRAEEAAMRIEWIGGNGGARRQPGPSVVRQSHPQRISAGGDPISWAGKRARGSASVAGVHVNEASSLEAAVSLWRALDPANLRGRISIMPGGQYSGACYGHSMNVPVDDKNIHWLYPGNPHGSFTEALADALLFDWSADAAALIDMHGEKCGKI